MKSTIKSVRNRVQIPANATQIQNYYYYSDRIIGSGNYSVVYEAFSIDTSKKVLIQEQRIAAKVINLKLYSEKKMVELLEQQIQILLTLDHPNIIKCHDVLKTSEECYCFTQLCEGGSLAQVIGHRGRLSEDEAWPYIRDIYEGLNYLSSKGVIHRDIKAANIFLKEGVAKIADFGFAVHARQDIVRSRSSFHDLNIGSPVYMAPQGYIDNTYGPKTDVWAFGIVIYELLHGKTPFTHIEDPQILIKALKVQLKIEDFRQEISSQLKQLMRSCLQINQTKRISMAQIRFTSYMQKRLYSRYINNTNDFKANQAKETIHRYKSSTNYLTPNSLTVVRHNNENNRLEVPSNNRIKVTNSKVIRIPSSIKYQDHKNQQESYSVLERSPIRITLHQQRIKASEPNIRVIEPKNTGEQIRRVPYVSMNRYFYDKMYEPLSAQLK